MGIKKIRDLLFKELPVLFVNIGWTNEYDGTEPVIGNSRYLRTHPEDTGEKSAFKSDGGRVYRCGMGRGVVVDGRLHVAFCARHPLDGRLKLVGLYANARHETDEQSGWASAMTRDAILIPCDRRPVVKNWPEGQGMRRWARGGKKSHPALLREFDLFIRRLARVLSYKRKGPKLEGEAADQTYPDLSSVSGQLKKVLINHRNREGKLRKAKIAEAIRRQRHLACEVPGCGFDFKKKFGPLGDGYAHVHHKIPLAQVGKKGQKMTIDDLVIVCANCHAMIHRGGGCLDYLDLLKWAHRRGPR